MLIQNASVIHYFNVEIIYFTKILEGKKKANTLISKHFKAGGQIILFKEVK